MTLVHPFPGHTALTTFEHLRRDLEGLIVRDTTGKMRAGVLPDHLNPLVTGRNTDMKLNVGDFRAVQNRGGAVLLANVGVDTSVTLVPPVANKRIDLIYATARSSNAPWSDGAGNNTPIIDVYQGTPGAVPQVPTLPAYLSSAIVLAMVEVPSNATTTLSAGVVITQLYPYTALAGGTVVVRNLVELAAWTPADGSRAFCIADNAEYVRTGGQWVVVEQVIASASFFTPGTGITLSTASWVRRRWNTVRGELVLASTTDFVVARWLGNVGAAYLPSAATGDKDLSIRVSQGGASTLGLAVLTRSDMAIRNYVGAPSNRRASIDFEWPIA